MSNCNDEKFVKRIPNYRSDLCKPYHSFEICNCEMDLKDLEIKKLKEQIGMANVLIMIGKKNIEHRVHGGLDHFNTYENKYLIK